MRLGHRTHLPCARMMVIIGQRSRKGATSASECRGGSHQRLTRLAGGPLDIRRLGMLSAPPRQRACRAATFGQHAPETHRKVSCAIAVPAQCWASLMLQHGCAHLQYGTVACSLWRACVRPGDERRSGAGVLGLQQVNLHRANSRGILQHACRNQYLRRPTIAPL